MKWEWPWDWFFLPVALVASLALGWCVQLQWEARRRRRLRRFAQERDWSYAESRDTPDFWSFLEVLGGTGAVVIESLSGEIDGRESIFVSCRIPGPHGTSIAAAAIREPGLPARDSSLTTLLDGSSPQWLATTEEWCVIASTGRMSPQWVGEQIALFREVRAKL